MSNKSLRRRGHEAVKKNGKSLAGNRNELVHNRVAVTCFTGHSRGLAHTFHQHVFIDFL